MSVPVADAHLELRPALREGGVDGDGVGEDLGIGDDGAAPVVGADHGGAGLDPLDAALVAVDHDLVAHPEGPPDQQQETCEPVLQDVLEGEADRHGGDAEPRHEVAGPEGGQNDDKRHQHAGEDHGPLEEGAQDRAEVGPVAALAPAPDGLLQPPADRGEDQEQEGRHHEVGQEPLEALDPGLDLVEDEPGIGLQRRAQTVGLGGPVRGLRVGFEHRPPFVSGRSGHLARSPEPANQRPVLMMPELRWVLGIARPGLAHPGPSAERNARCRSRR